MHPQLFILEQFTFDQYIKLDHKWIDPKKKNYGKTTICKCGMNFYPNWQIQSLKEDYLVSTIHTSLGLISNLDFFDNTTDYFYETMIFDQKNNNWLPFLARYKTREKATSYYFFDQKSLFHKSNLLYYQRNHNW